MAHCLQRQSIPADDIPLKNVFHRFPACILCMFFVRTAILVVKDIKKPFAAFHDIIIQLINAIDTGYGKNSIPLVFQLAFSITEFYNAQFPFQDFRQKITRTAGRLKEPRINSLRLLFHQIKHCIYFPPAGIHLTMIGDSLF